MKKYQTGLDTLLQESEKRMYADKAAYYKRTGIDRRNSRYSGVSKSSIFGWNFFFGSFYKRENKNIKKVLDEKKMLW